jgi:hypothetical protein
MCMCKLFLRLRILQDMSPFLRYSRRAKLNEMIMVMMTGAVTPVPKSPCYLRAVGLVLVSPGQVIKLDQLFNIYILSVIYKLKLFQLCVIGRLLKNYLVISHS